MIKSLSNLTSEDLGIEDLNLALNLSTRSLIVHHIKKMKSFSLVVFFPTYFSELINKIIFEYFRLTALIKIFSFESIIRVYLAQYHAVLVYEKIYQ